MSVTTSPQTKTARPQPLKKPAQRKNDFVSLDGLLTVEQWVALPRTKPPYELHDGQLVQKDMPPVHLVPGRTEENGFINRDALFTVQQWAAMPELKPPYELIRGRLVQKMVTTNEHDWTTNKFWRQCDEWADASRWHFFAQGPGVEIDENTGYIPDVMGFLPQHQLERSATYNQKPFIVVEVLSKGTIKFDRADKKQNYARVGVQLYVIVDPSRHTMEVYRLKNGVYDKPEILREADVWQPAELPGLRLELARLWM